MKAVLKPCPCGSTAPLEGRHDGLCYTATCPRCVRVASAFTMEGLFQAWNDEALPAQRLKVKRPKCENRALFESDHAGPFGALLDARGDELDEYATPRTQEDWLLWLRAQAAHRTVEQDQDLPCA